MMKSVQKPFLVLECAQVATKRVVGGGPVLKPGCYQGQSSFAGVRRIGECMRLNAQGLRVPPNLPQKDWSMDADDVVDDEPTGMVGL